MFTVVCDLTNDSAVENMVKQVGDHFKQIDLLVNFATKIYLLWLFANIFVCLLQLNIAGITMLNDRFRHSQMQTYDKIMAINLRRWEMQRCCSNELIYYQCYVFQCYISN